MEIDGRRAFLIVDDEPLVRMDLAEIVRDCDYEPFEAANVAEALAILDSSAESFAGVITDIQMPGTRNGLTLANHVRVMWPELKIIVVSGGKAPLNGQMPERALFFSKPVSPRNFITALTL